MSIFFLNKLTVTATHTTARGGYKMSRPYGPILYNTLHIKRRKNKKQRHEPKAMKADIQEITLAMTINGKEVVAALDFSFPLC